MPVHYSEPGYPAKTEPLRRFYPNQDSPSLRQIPSAPPTAERLAPEYKRGDASYLMHRHPVLLQRLYDAANVALSAYHANDFIYDAYPDYLSLRLMRDRILRDNRPLTEEFLQAGCGAEWLNLLTDSVLSELLSHRRETYRSPRGEAKTTSVRSMSLS